MNVSVSLIKDEDYSLTWAQVKNAAGMYILKNDSLKRTFITFNNSGGSFTMIVMDNIVCLPHGNAFINSCFKKIDRKIQINIG